MAEVKPITPDEVIEQLLKDIPDEVLQAVNEGIKSNWNGVSAIVLQKDIKNRTIELMDIDWNGFKNQWLDFEQHYKNSGWKVEYHKQHIGDTFDSYFKFWKK